MPSNAHPIYIAPEKFKRKRYRNNERNFRVDFYLLDGLRIFPRKLLIDKYIQFPSSNGTQFRRKKTQFAFVNHNSDNRTNMSSAFGS